MPDDPLFGRPLVAPMTDDLPTAIVRDDMPGAPENCDCADCQGPVEPDGTSRIECAAGRYGTDDDNCCTTCGGCYCDGAC